MLSAMQNVNPAELVKFEALAADWWDPKGRLRTLHIINPVRLKYIKTEVDLKNKSVLDIGCGGGLLCEAMAREGARVTGLDASALSISIASEHRTQAGLGIDYHRGTIEEFAAAATRQYDVITCMEMLEHVPDPPAVLAAAGKLLRPGGHIFLSTLNRTIKAYAGAVLAAEYLLGILPRETHNYAQFIRPSELSGWLRAAGFTLSDISGMSYLPLLDHAALTADTSINYLVHARLES
jgi:2-polyprenyl-6-hydroxyphenyl methylase/3-demethylubiquinone-9 3-methyltransferase